jgi:hypothetical protein
MEIKLSRNLARHLKGQTDVDLWRRLKFIRYITLYEQRTFPGNKPKPKGKVWVLNENHLTTLIYIGKELLKRYPGIPIAELITYLDLLV